MQRFFCDTLYEHELLSNFCLARGSAQQ